MKKFLLILLITLTSSIYTAETTVNNPTLPTEQQSISDRIAKTPTATLILGGMVTGGVGTHILSNLRGMTMPNKKMKEFFVLPIVLAVVIVDSIQETILATSFAVAAGGAVGGGVKGAAAIIYAHNQRKKQGK